MIRVCIIGDSHLSALKLAWDKISDQFTDIQIKFFGSVSNSLNELRIEQGALTPQSDRVRKNLAITSGGSTKIILDDYDIFVLHGLGFNINRLVKKLSLKPPESPLTFNEVKVILNQSLSYQLAKKIFPSRKPVLISPQPFPPEQILYSLKEYWIPWRRLFNEQGHPNPELQYLLNLWEQARISYEFLAQPENTINRQVLTKAEYNKGAVKLKAIQLRILTPSRYSIINFFSKIIIFVMKRFFYYQSNDDIHMNAAYGEEILKLMLHRCRELIKSNQQTISQKKEEPLTLQISNSQSKVHPYVNLPDRAFWRRTVSKPPLEISDWYQKKFPISNLRIATAGSCFAQHIGRRLRQHNFSYVDTEPSPTHLIPKQHLANGYGMYSARYGNIYTSRQLLQLLQRAVGDFTPQDVYWETKGGFVDPFRPTIQTQPFATIDELITEREKHLVAVRNVFQQAQVFIFTLGLTETWMSIKDGAVFPIAPGVSGERFDPKQYRFLNLGFNEVLQDLREFLNRVRLFNAQMKFIFTVSPVPLIATASGQQIVVATTYSKSVLRAVAGQLATNRKNVDYFPAFEIINSHIMRSQFYEPDLRSVSDAGVDHVMKIFFAEHAPPIKEQFEYPDNESDATDDIVCDEELLTAFKN